MKTPAVIREKAPQMELTALNKYFDDVWNFLETMKPGTKIPVEKICKSETKELFIAIVKYYMDWNRHNYQDGLSFKDGFLTLVKHDISLCFKNGKSVEV
jgi:hypothetical protein